MRSEHDQLMYELRWYVGLPWHWWFGPFFGIFVSSFNLTITYYNLEHML